MNNRSTRRSFMAAGFLLAISATAAAQARTETNVVYGMYSVPLC